MLPLYLEANLNSNDFYLSDVNSEIFLIINDIPVELLVSV